VSAELCCNLTTPRPRPTASTSMSRTDNHAFFTAVYMCLGVLSSLSAPFAEATLPILGVKCNGWERFVPIRAQPCCFEGPRSRFRDIWHRPVHQHAVRNWLPCRGSDAGERGERMRRALLRPLIIQHTNIFSARVKFSTDTVDDGDERFAHTAPPMTGCLPLARFLAKQLVQLEWVRRMWINSTPSISITPPRQLVEQSENVHASRVTLRAELL